MTRSGRDRSKIYKSYRKLRFLARKGTLLSIKEKETAGFSELSGSVSWIMSFNSLALFLLAYLFVFQLNLLITGLAAIANHIPVVLYYYGPDFLIRGRDWTVDSINIVFSSGPLFMLILAAILVILYIMVSTETGILRLFLLWAFYHAVTRTFGELLVGAVMSKGFGFVIIYLFIMDTGKLILTILAFLVLFTIGIIMAKQAFFSANIYLGLLRSSVSGKFVTHQFFVPFLLGNLLMVLVKLPDFNVFEMSVNATMVLLLIPLILKSKGLEDLYFDEDPRVIRLNIPILIVTIIAIALFRVIMAVGIRFQV
jgi:hypothetical protein